MKSSPIAATASAIPAPDHKDELLTARQLRTIAELGDDVGFAIALPEGSVRYLSPAFAALSGYDAGTLQGALDGDSASPLAPLAAWLRTTAAGTPGVRNRREFDLFDAERRPLALEALAIVPPDDTSTLVGLLRDLSVRRGMTANTSGSPACSIMNSVRRWRRLMARSSGWKRPPAMPRNRCVSAIARSAPRSIA